MWAADHDLFDPAYVASCVSTLEADPAAVLAYSHTMYINEDGKDLYLMDDELEIDQADPLERYSALIGG